MAKASKVAPAKKELKPAKQQIKENLQVKEQPCVIEIDGKKVAVTGLQVSSGVTLNLGDYESARYDVGITVAPMQTMSAEELAEAGWSFVLEELGLKIKQTRENAAKKEKGKNG